MIEKARVKFPRYTFRVGDMANLDLVYNGQFDNVVSLYGSIAYANPQVFKDVVRLLKPKGRYFLMLFNKRYLKRKTYILNRHNLQVRFYSFKDVKNLLPAKYVAVGFNYHGDFFDFLPKSLIKLILRVERKLLGRLFKTKAFFCLVYGEKP